MQISLSPEASLACAGRMASARYTYNTGGLVRMPLTYYTPSTNGVFHAESGADVPSYLRSSCGTMNMGLCGSLRVPPGGPVLIHATLHRASLSTCWRYDLEDVRPQVSNYASFSGSSNLTVSSWVRSAVRSTSNTLFMPRSSWKKHPGSLGRPSNEAPHLVWASDALSVPYTAQDIASGSENLLPPGCTRG